MQTVETKRRMDDSEDGNGFGGGAIVRTEATMDIAVTRAAQEVQAAMVIAKRFPRDENAAYQRIMQACKRKSLAEASLYAYPKGKEMITGPSIRMAEVLARAWGNIDFGIIELEQSEGESSVMTYAWDLETNTRQTKVFTVRHVRHTRKGQYGLDDPREIYELTANQGARRLRACILGVIPGDVVEAAINECEKTMQGGNREPLADRIRAMLVAFADMGVTQGMIEARLGHRAEAIIETELVNLKKIYRSLKDNMASREDFFEVNGGKSSSVDDRLSRAANGNGNGNGNTHKPASQPQANDSTPAEAQGQPVQQTRHEPPQPEQKLAGTTGTLVVDPEVIAGEKPDTGAPGKLAWDYVRDVVPAKAPQGMEPDAARFTFSSYIRRTYAAGNKTAKVPEIWDSLTVEQQIGVMDLLESGDFPFVAKKQ